MLYRERLMMGWAACSVASRARMPEPMDCEASADVSIGWRDELREDFMREADERPVDVASGAGGKDGSRMVSLLAENS